MDVDFRQALRASEQILNSAAFGRVEALRQGIANGGDVNFQRAESTPLMLSVRNNHPDCVRVLLENGANPRLGMMSGWKPIHEAARYNQTELVRILAAHTPDTVGDVNNNDDTALMVAIANDAAESFDCVLEAGIEGILNHRNYDGETALFLATRAESSAMVAALIARGADPSIADRGGVSPADLAAKNGWAEGVGLLAQARRAWGAQVAPSAESVPDPDEPSTPAGPALSSIGKRRFR